MDEAKRKRSERKRSERKRSEEKTNEDKTNMEKTNEDKLIKNEIKRNEIKRNKIDDKEYANLLISSINSDDTTYISEYLVLKNAHKQLKYLEDEHKEKLSLMLTEFLNTPLRIQAMDLLKKLANTKVLNILRQRALNFDKMIYLKGKIDFLKMRCTKSVKHVPENEIEP